MRYLSMVCIILLMLGFHRRVFASDVDKAVDVMANAGLTNPVLVGQADTVLAFVAYSKNDARLIVFIRDRDTLHAPVNAGEVRLGLHPKVSGRVETVIDGSLIDIIVVVKDVSKKERFLTEYHYFFSMSAARTVCQFRGKSSYELLPCGNRQWTDVDFTYRDDVGLLDVVEAIRLQRRSGRRTGSCKVVAQTLHSTQSVWRMNATSCVEVN